MNDLNERVLLRTLNGKKRVVLPRKQYELIKEFILNALATSPQVSLMELMELANLQLVEAFPNGVALPLLNTKQDLEAHGLIEVTYQKGRTQFIALKKKPLKPVANTAVFSNRDLAALEEHRERQKKWTLNY